jgi:hypothetical protein
MAFHASATAGAANPKRVAYNAKFGHTVLDTADLSYDAQGHLANGSPPLPGDTVIFDNNTECPELVPVTDLAGNPVTLAEWQAIKGEAHAMCTGDGTWFTLKMKGLIPGGLYTVWIGPFVGEGMLLNPDGGPDFSNGPGLGALGQPDGSENSFYASADGKAELSVFQPAGPLSAFGSMPACLFGETEGQQITQVILTLALHLDGKTYGPVPHTADNPCSVVFPGGFNFKL